MIGQEQSIGPVFVVGNSRSGTTMMGHILRNHPLIFTLPHELHFFEQLCSSDDYGRELSFDEAVALASRLLCINHDSYWRQGDPSRFLEEARTLVLSIQNTPLTPAVIFERFLRYAARKVGKTIPCDQTPRYSLYVDDILRLYPGARVINMIRDPRPILLSQKNKWKRRWMGYRDFPLKESIRTKINYHPVTISVLWNASVRAVSPFASHPRVLFVKFEDLLREPEAEVRRICGFLGVDYHGGMLDIPQGGSSLARFTTNKGIDGSRAVAWRRGGLNDTEIFICQKITGPLMKRYGYEPVPARANPLRLLWYGVSLPLKLTLSFLVNLGRMKNIPEALRRRLRR